jgi:hypothetical protein
MDFVGDASIEKQFTNETIILLVCSFAQTSL